MNSPDKPSAKVRFDEALDAVRRGDIERLRSMLEQTPQLALDRWSEEPEGDGPTLLHLSTCCDTMKPPANAHEVSRVLIEYGADVDDRGQRGTIESPLHWAASVGRTDIVHLLIDAGADLDPTGGCIANGTPLFLAMCFDNLDAARALVERGAACSIQIAAGLGDIDRVAEYFDDEGRIKDDAAQLPCFPELSAEHGLNLALWWASYRDSLEIVQYLCERGADVNFVSPTDSTPLEEALAHDKTAIADYLREQGARSRGARPGGARPDGARPDGDA